jgi:NADPH:quinone reductase-like Zn-dependent oxidoreductase
MYAVQLAKLARTAAGDRLQVYATASPHNHKLLKGLGADAVVDYRSPNWVEEVVRLSGGISYAFDCLSEGNSTGLISQTFVPEGGRIAVIRSAAYATSLIRDGVCAVYGAAWSGLGVELHYNSKLVTYVCDVLSKANNAFTCHPLPKTLCLWRTHEPGNSRLTSSHFSRMEGRLPSQGVYLYISTRSASCPGGLSMWSKMGSVYWARILLRIDQIRRQ